MSVVDQVDRWLGRVSFALAMIGCIWLGGLAVLVCVDVIGRARGAPVPGVVEIAATSVVAVAFLFLPYTMHRRGHVRSTMIRNRLPTRAQTVIDVIAYGLGTVIFAAVAWASWERMVRAWVTSEYAGEGALRVPAAPTRTVLLIAVILMALECAVAAVRSVTGTSTYRPEGG
jgi:C4-dicarboxylate transporter, DctM subunit